MKKQIKIPLSYMPDMDEEKIQKEVIAFVKKNPNAVPNDVYRHFNGYDWDPEYVLDMNAERVGNVVNKMIEDGILKVDRKYHLSV